MDPPNLLTVIYKNHVLYYSETSKGLPPASILKCLVGLKKAA